MNKITSAYIVSRIVKTTFHRIPDTTLTIAVIHLDNGFTVTGESACVDPANFDQAVGEHIAESNAFQKLWPLFGFMLAETNHRNLLHDACERHG